MLDESGSASDLGLVMAARILPVVLFVLVGGVWADRVRRDRLMVASNVVRFGAQGTLALLITVGGAQIWHFVALQAVWGFGAAFFGPASSGIVPQAVGRELLQRANALLFLSDSTGAIVGPALGGILVVLVGPGPALAADAVTFAVSALLLSRLRITRVGETTTGTPFLRDLSAGWRVVRSRTWIWASVVDFSLFQLVVLGTFGVLGPVIAEQELNGASSWAVIVTAFGLGSVIGNVVALRVRPRRPLVAAYAAIVGVAPGLVLLGLGAPTPVIAAAQVVAGAAGGFAGILWETTLQEKVPREVLSRVVAFDRMGSVGLRPLGLAAAGPAAVVFGADATLVAAGVFVVVSTAVLLAVPDVRALVRDHEPEQAVLAETRPAALAAAGFAQADAEIIAEAPAEGGRSGHDVAEPLERWGQSTAR